MGPHVLGVQMVAVAEARMDVPAVAVEVIQINNLNPLMKKEC